MCYYTTWHMDVASMVASVAATTGKSQFATVKNVVLQLDSVAITFSLLYLF